MCIRDRSNVMPNYIVHLLFHFLHHFTVKRFHPRLVGGALQIISVNWLIYWLTDVNFNACTSDLLVTYWRNRNQFDLTRVSTFKPGEETIILYRDEGGMLTLSPRPQRWAPYTNTRPRLRLSCCKRSTLSTLCTDCMLTDTCNTANDNDFLVIKSLSSLHLFIN